jgi:hypothetical protein
VRSLSDLFRNVMQLGYVTEDLDVATAFFESTLGTSTCRKNYKSSLGGVVVVDGETAEEWVIDVALVNAGATNLEIIKPVSGSVDLYRSAIRPGVPATFHHVGFRVDDFDEATAVVAASGRSWKQYGNFAGSVRFGYVDMTAELGHFVEVMEVTPMFDAYLTQLEAESNAGR